MTALRVSEPILEETYAHLAACGRGLHECVVYWVASRADPDVVSEIVHPVHRSGSFGYEVDSDWVNSFFLGLLHDRKTVRVQIHTHPKGASHSSTDDRFALAPSTGFLSLVIPDFALGPPDLAGCHLVEMQSDGEWAEVDPEATFVLG